MPHHFFRDDRVEPGFKSPGDKQSLPNWPAKKIEASSNEKLSGVGGRHLVERNTFIDSDVLR